MKVYAHKWFKNNEKVCIGQFNCVCRSPFGILDPQPTSPQEIQIIVISKSCQMIDDVPKREPGTDYVESNVLKADPKVEVFSLSEVDDDVLVAMAETAEQIAVGLPDAAVAPTEEAPVEEPSDFANYSTSELLKLCDSLGIKARKNASRASLVEKLVAAAKA